MIYFATLFWQANDASFDFSRQYSTEWVERLYRGVARNCRYPFRFIVWTDQLRVYREPIEQRPITNPMPGYADCVQPYEASDEAPMILMGLDSVITGDLTDLVRYAKNAEVLALPRDPYTPHVACNGVALIPQGHAWVWNEWVWGANPDDMERCRSVEHAFIDDLFPGQVVSFKGQARDHGLGDARIVYFHGQEKPHQLVGGGRSQVPWIRDHWR